MTEQEIETKVIKIVSEQMSVEKETITRDTSFVGQAVDMINKGLAAKS